jgi:hypothetical protein
MNPRPKSQAKTVSVLASARAARSTIALDLEALGLEILGLEILGLEILGLKTLGLETPLLAPTCKARKQPIRNRRSLHWSNGWGIPWNNRWIKREAT